MAVQPVGRRAGKNEDGGMVYRAFDRHLDKTCGKNPPRAVAQGGAGPGRQVRRGEPPSFLRRAEYARPAGAYALGL